MAVEVYDLYPASSGPPPFIRRCSETYADWRRKDQARVDIGEAEGREADLDAMSNTELETIVSTHDDLAIVTKAARILIGHLHQELSTASPFGSSLHTDGKRALAVANNITKIADRVIDMVWAVRDRIDPEIGKLCVYIADAAVDAHRLRSRSRDREGSELGLLLHLRIRDLDITRDHRAASDVALGEYHRDIARALLTGDTGDSIDSEIGATQRLLDALLTMKAKIHDPEAKNSRRDPSPVVRAEDFDVVVKRIASFLVALRGDRVRYDKADDCASRVLKLYGPKAKQDRVEVIELLNAARAETAQAVAPVITLRIVKYRGVGEMLTARILREIATAEISDANVVQKVYLNHPIDERRRTRVLQRAAGLYQRAIEWLRSCGVEGVLREIAIAELSETEGDIQESTGAKSGARHDRANDAHQAIVDLRENLDSMIVAGLLQADLNAWTDMQDRAAREAAADLIGALNEAVHYLRKPEIGFRTDLPILVD